MGYDSRSFPPHIGRTVSHARIEYPLATSALYVRGLADDNYLFLGRSLTFGTFSNLCN